MPNRRRIGRSADPRQHEALLARTLRRTRADWPSASSTACCRDQRYGKNQAGKVLALLGTYARADLLAALERAVRFGAYSLNAVERILAAQAQPKSVLDIAGRAANAGTCPPHLRDNPVPPRPTADYQPPRGGTDRSWPAASKPRPPTPPPTNPTDDDPGGPA